VPRLCELYPGILPEFFPKIQRPRLQVNHPPPSGAQIKNELNHTSTPYLCLRVITGKSCFISNTMKKLFFMYTHDSTSSSSSSRSSSSNTISVTRVFYSPNSGRANQNVNCHNLLRVSTPFFPAPFSDAAIAGDPSEVITKTCHALPNNSKSLIQSLHQQFRLQYLYSQQLLLTFFQVE
jgi:hypothetical protein